MTRLEIFRTQTEDAYQWINRLLEPVPRTVWDRMPEVVESTLNWQVGHLLMSHYFHAILVIKGPDRETAGQMPLAEYSQFFTNTFPSLSIGQFDSGTLFSHLQIMQQASLLVMNQLTDEELDQPLEPTRIKHPIASTKGESLDWNTKHTMYHGGQIGLLKRILFERHDFGLRV